MAQHGSGSNREVTPVENEGITTAALAGVGEEPVEINPSEDEEEDVRAFEEMGASEEGARAAHRSGLTAKRVAQLGGGAVGAVVIGGVLATFGAPLAAAGAAIGALAGAVTGGAVVAELPRGEDLGEALDLPLRSEAERQQHAIPRRGARKGSGRAQAGGAGAGGDRTGGGGGGGAGDRAL